LFPVIDFQTMRRTYYQRDIHLVAQQGIDWMARGAMQLALYRLVYHLKPPFSPETVTSLPGLIGGMFLVYLLYLRVSGQFHIIVGMLHLFGYDLPETHKKYLLAESLTDFWRRINIYWKDFMVKIVYFPLYFRFRRRGETTAQVIATASVFVVTWATHSYQWFWLKGEVLLTWPDTIFWAVLGALVVVNVLIENRRRLRQERPVQRTPRWLNVSGTLLLIIVLWSLWNSPSISEWLDVMTWWQIG
jgi:D-alanyl-lipoteichoic acid acyltransferase DltB (MBOAT superfamily)